MSDNEQKIIALVPMKAHSERVKGKNFRSFAGKPLFRWILDALLSIEDVDLVVINTDARDILAKNGLESSGRVLIRDRRPELRGDLVSMNLIIQDDVNNIPADIYIMTHTTNPLLKAGTIRTALAEFKAARARGEADSLFSVNRVQTRFYRRDGSAVNHDPNNLVRTQDLEPWYEENSNLYIFTAESFFSTNARIGKKPMLYETPRLESIDIDTPVEWSLSEIICQHLDMLNYGEFRS